jgi:hypothetical protein
MTKKLTLTIITLLSVQIANAQLYIGANAGINNTKLYNSSDAKADERQDYVLTFKSQFGMEVGYKVNNKIGIGMQPQLYNAGQNYKGVPDDSLDIQTMEATLKLTYIKLPVNIKYTFQNDSRKLRSFMVFGFNIGYLINYHEKISYVRNPTLMNRFSTLNMLTLNNLEGEAEQRAIVNNVNTTSKQRVKTDRPLYNKMSLGLNLGTGLNYNITPKVNLFGTVLANFGLTNVENRDLIQLINTSTGMIEGSSKTSNYLDFKYNASPRPNDKKRSIFTNNRAIGLQVGVTYLLGNKERLQPKKF